MPQSKLYLNFSHPQLVTFDAKIYRKDIKPSSTWRKRLQEEKREFSYFKDSWIASKTGHCITVEEERKLRLFLNGKEESKRNDKPIKKL